MANRIQTEIDIAVKGSAEVKKISKALDNLYGEITQVNNKTGEFVKNFSNLNNILSLVKKNFDNAASGTLQQEKAARLLLVAERQLNKEYQQREALLQRLRTAPMPLPGTGIGRDRSPESFKNRNMKGKRSSLIPGRSLFGQSVTVEGGASGRSRQILQEEQALQEALARMNQRSFGRFKFLPPEELTGQSESIFRGQSSPVEAKIKQTLANRKKSEIEIADIRNRALQKVQANEQRLITLRKNAIKSASGNTGVFSSSAANLVQRGPITGTASQGSRIKSMHKTGFSAFSARADEISRLATAEQNLSTIRNQAAEKLKSQASIERRRAKTESFGANFRRFRRNRPGDRGIRQQVFQSAGIGGGFPLLFGGGPLQAAAGALGGGIGGLFGKGGGFAGSIVATAVVQTIQQTVTAIADLGKAMGPFTQDTNALVNAMGLAGTAEAARLQIIEQLEGKQAAFNAAMQKMRETIGTKATKRLEEFGKTSQLIGSEFKIAMTKMQASLIPVINLVDKLLGLSKGAREAQQKRFIENSTDANIVSRREEIERLRNTTGGGRSGNKRRSDRIKVLEQELKLRAQVGIIEQETQTRADELTLEFAQHVKKIQEKADLEKEVAKLMAGGMKQSVAEQIAQNNILADQARKRLEVELEILKAKIADPDAKGESLKNAIVSYNAIKKALQDIGVEQDKINKLTEEFGKKTEKVKVTKEQITNLLANEMTSAVMGLIEGTKTLGEALASVAKSLASMFLNAAFQNIFSGLFSGGGTTPAPVPGVLTAQGGFYKTGGFKAFQYGGVVNSPTLGMIGEGGESEYVIPASKMSGAMARYSAGARGGAVIPGGSHESGTVAGSSGNTVVEYTGPTLNFNGDEYVPKSAVPDIIGAASKQGAMAGKAQTMNTLRNSRSQRASLGL